jgi:hypothetical protein
MWGRSGAQIIDSALLDPDVTAAISHLSFRNGQVTLKLHDKLAALIALGRELGMFRH